MTDVTQPQTDSRLRGNGLTIIRILWVSLALAALGMFILSLPGYLRPLEAGPIQASAEFVAVLNGIGVLASLAAAVVSLGLAGLLFWRRPDDAMALFLSFFFLGYGIVMAGPLERVRAIWPALRVDVELAQAVIFTTLFAALFGLFPNGRFVPGWMRWVTLASLGFIPLYYLLPCCDFSKVNSALLGFLMVCWLAMMAAVVYAQVHRYRHVSSLTERQQTKWVVYGLVLYLLMATASTIPYILAQRLPPDAPRPWWALLASVAWWLSLAIMPLALTFSVLRYRLFEIDVIIKRTVQYTLLSGAGFVVYLLAVGGTSLFIQSNTQLIAGVIVLALFVVFFNPARKRLQAMLDKLMPVTPPPPEVLAEIEAHASRVEAERKRKEKMDAQKQTAADGTRLQGGWLTAARAIWIILSATAVIAFVAEAILIWNAPLPSCVAASVNCGPWQVSGEDMALARQLGFSESFMLLAYFGGNLLARLSFVVVGVLIFWRKSDDVIALLLSFMLAGFLTEGIQHLGAFMPVVTLLYALSSVAFFLLPFVFPNGAFVPRWSRWAVWPLVALSLPPALLPLIGVKLDDTVFSFWLLGSFVMWFLVAGYAAMYRYQRISNPVERQQTKWVMLGIFGTFIIFIPFTIITLVFPPAQPSVGRLAFVYLVSIPIGVLSYLFFSGAIAVAVFRYRLFDIDIIIRKTVQYSVLSGAAFVVYLLAVGGTSLFLQQRNELVAGVFALALVVVFFNPARKRLQAFMDKVMPYTPRRRKCWPN